MEGVCRTPELFLYSVLTVTNSPSEGREVLRFGEFELDVVAYQLRRAGEPVPLERRPMDLLILLATRHGELVTRADIVDHLWGKDVFVDVETGIHTAVRKIRRALEDSTDAPSFVETVPGRGYRFVAPVAVESSAAPQPASVATTPAETERRRLLLKIAIGVLAVAVSAAVLWTKRDRPPTSVSLAVLPFDNVTGEREQQYLANGLTEEMIAALGQIDPDRLRVLGRTSTIAYRGTQKSALQIGNELGVDYLVEGTVQAEHERVRVTSRLIRARDQLQLWSAVYDRTDTSILGLQSELSAAIAEQIRLRLSPERMKAIERRHTRNAEAYHAYLRGLEFAGLRTPAGNRQAIDSFELATRLDPGYALAWSALARVHAASTINADAPPLEVRPRARAAAQRAVALDPTLPEAQYALGHILWILEWQWPEAETTLRRAVALDPTSAEPHMMLGHCLSQMGRHSEAMAEMRRARELAPLADMAHALSAQVAFQARDYPAAVGHARQAAAIQPGLWIASVFSAQALYQLGERERALAELQHATRYSEGNSKTLALRGYILAKSGHVAEARDVLATLTEAASGRYVPPYAFALVHAGLGERDATFLWLDRAFAARDVHLVFLTVDPVWDEYRSDARFRALIARCGFTRTAAPGSR